MGKPSGLKLSLVVPCYNAVLNSTRLQTRIRGLRNREVEVVLVDDGSTDGTLAMLRSVAEDAAIAVTVLANHNTGPGGARNAGLEVARGRYVWFVDCDDDVLDDAIDEVLRLEDQSFDFIDFNLVGHPEPNTMFIAPGDYVVSSELELVAHFGRLNTKVYSREWLARHHVRYPANCMWEDAGLALLLPLLAQSFHKSAIAGYAQHLEFDSITRSQLTPNFFDRLVSAVGGVELALELPMTVSDRLLLIERFTELYLFFTFKNIRRLVHPSRTSIHNLISERNLRGLMREALVRLAPTSRWKAAVLSMRTMRQFRDVVARLQISYSLRKGAHPVLDGSSRRVFRVLWALSFTLGNQQAFFDGLREQAWPESRFDAEPEN